MGRKSLFLVLALLIVVFTGCINYENTFTLNNDGSGKVHIHYWIAEETYKMMNQPNEKGEVPPDVFTEEEAKKTYGGEGLTISNFKAYTDKEEKPNKHAELDVNFKDVSDLSKTKHFQNWTFSFSGEGTANFAAVLPAEEKDTEGMTEEEKESAEKMTEYLKDYTYTTIINFPGKVLETNGEIDPKDPKKVTWSIDMKTMTDEGINYTAKIQLGAGGGSMTGIIIIIAVILVVIIIAIVAGGKKKEAPAPVADEEDTTEE